MKRLTLISSLALIFIFGVWPVGPAPFLAQACIEVQPEAHNFGSVQVDTSVTTVITIQNTCEFFLTVTDVYIESGSAEFEITPPLPLPATINPPDGVIHAIYVGVTFTPSAAEAFSETLVIESSDPVVTISLVGTGVPGEPPTPPPSIEDILAFFDQSVADGTLCGYGPGNSADGRRKALRNKIRAAGDLIAGGLVDDACEQLLDAYQRCDYLARPPDFVAGPAAPILAQMILKLTGDLGCE